MLPGLDDLAPINVPELEQSNNEVHWDSDLQPSERAIARFWKKVVKSPSCWFFIGTISSPDGYGRVTFQRGTKQRTLSAHRFALLVSGIHLEPGIVGEHFCNEPLCVRVDKHHLHASTQKQNMEYAASLGRLHGRHPAAHQSISRVERSRRIREALKYGWDEQRFFQAIGQTDSKDQIQLFSLDDSVTQGLT